MVRVFVRVFEFEMESRALMMEVASGARAVRLRASSALASCSSFSSSFALLTARQPHFCKQTPRISPLRGTVKVVGNLGQASEGVRRSTFGRGSVFSCRSRPEFRGQATKQTFSSFDDMLENSKVPMLVDFYATWCGPCQMMVPILSEVSNIMQDKLRVVKIDTEKYPELASRFNIRALPTMVLFKGGKVADRIEGALRAEDIIDRISKVL